MVQANLFDVGVFPGTKVASPFDGKWTKSRFVAPLPYPFFVSDHESQVSCWVTQLPNFHSAGLLSVPLSSPRLSRFGCSGNMLCYYIPLHFQCLHLLIQTKILTHIHVKQKSFQKIYIPHCVINVSSWSEQKARRQSKASCSIFKESLRAAIDQIWSQKKGSDMLLLFANHKVTGQKKSKTKSRWFNNKKKKVFQLNRFTELHWATENPNSWFQFRAFKYRSKVPGRLECGTRAQDGWWSSPASATASRWGILAVQRIPSIKSHKGLKNAKNSCIQNPGKLKQMKVEVLLLFTLHFPSHVITHSPKPHLAEVAQATKGFFIEFVFHDLPL